MDELHHPQIIDERDAVENYGIASTPVEQWDTDYLDELYAEAAEDERIHRALYNE